MKKLYLRLRYLFFDIFGERTSYKTYLGHGNFDEVNGWDFRGKFYTCDPSGSGLGFYGSGFGNSVNVASYQDTALRINKG